ncbi:MAG: toxin-antitoxin system antitoxin subunit [Parasutterella sp.]
MTKVFFKSSDAKPWTAEELQRLQNIRDEDIDYSNIPPTDPNWENAIQENFIGP